HCVKHIYQYSIHQNYPWVPKGDWRLWEILKRQWILHIKENPITYLLIVFIFTTGIMAGAFTVISLSSQQKLNVSIFLQEFFNSQQSLSINRWAIFKESLWKHFVTVFFIWFFGIFIWGSPFIL